MRTSTYKKDPFGTIGVKPTTTFSFLNLLESN